MAGPKYAKVDPVDYERLNGYEWYLNRGRKTFRTLRHIPGGKGKKESIIYMHQEILKVPKGMVVDHINQDGMDNRRMNLRAATQAQNARNRKKSLKSGSSIYKGVTWDKANRKWLARIGFDYKAIFLGHFKNEIDAAKAYDEAAKKYHGEFACLNFPE